MLNFDRSTVKHGTQNIEMIATSGFLIALEFSAGALLTALRQTL